MESRLPIDILNPGQVFACLGIVEIADALLGDAKGCWEWNGNDSYFCVSANGDVDPIQSILEFLVNAEVFVRFPFDSKNIQKWKDTWKATKLVDEKDRDFPFPDPNSPATLPALLIDEHGRTIEVNYWGDDTNRDNVKFFAGAGGYPGAALLADALKLVKSERHKFHQNPLELFGEQSSSFRFDWRRDYVPADIGFSINKHKNIQAIGFPLVEVLAAVGVTHARPFRRENLQYLYSIVSGQLLRPIFLRAILGAQDQLIYGLKLRHFIMELAWPAKEGSARCITQIYEYKP